MAGDRKIDERDIDQLLAALSDRQIANLFEMEEQEVFRLRKQRRNIAQTANSTNSEEKKS